jgi:hypothetical protein
MLFEVLGDIWVVQRNPYLQDDLLDNPKRRDLLVGAMRHRLREIEKRRADRAQLGRRADASATRRSRSSSPRPTKPCERFERAFADTAALRRTRSPRPREVDASDNIAFGGFARVAHVTDATDWRVEYPFVVLCPDTEDEVRGLVEACIELGLTIIPRGGGTGYTGGAIPLTARTAVINTEKLERLSSVERIAIRDGGDPVPTIDCGAGVVTKRVMDAAEAAASSSPSTPRPRTRRASAATSR